MEQHSPQSEFEHDPITLKKVNGIGWYMVQRVTCSTDRVSRLTNPQIQYIINSNENQNQVTAKADIHIDYDYLYFDDEFDYDSTPQTVKETNEDKVDDDIDSMILKMPDSSDDDGYNEYGGYDGGYYYCDGRYERKVSPMMSPIISDDRLGELFGRIEYSHRLNYRIFF